MADLFDSNAVPYDVVYANVRDLPKYAPYKAHAEKLWNNFEPYADTEFLSEIQKAFHQRFWEMYLGNALLQIGHHIGSSLNNHGPDLFVQKDEMKIWIEAVAAKKGEGPDAPVDPQVGMVEVMPGLKIDAVPEKESVDDYDDLIGFSTPSGEKFRINVKAFDEVPILLRYRTAIDAKVNKYSSYLAKGRVNENEPYVIAVNGAGIPLDMTQDEPPRILKALFGLGDEQRIIDRSTMEVIEATFTSRPQIIKQSGKLVPINIFSNSSHEGISAILYSTVDVANCPYNLGSDFVLVHNPNAKNPLPLGSLKVGTEYWVDEDGQLMSEKFVSSNLQN